MHMLESLEMPRTVKTEHRKHETHLAATPSKTSKMTFHICNSISTKLEGFASIKLITHNLPGVIWIYISSLIHWEDDLSFPVWEGRTVTLWYTAKNFL